MRWEIRCSRSAGMAVQLRRNMHIAMAEAKDVPEEDREEVVAYVGAQFKGLHEGNVIRYRLKPEDLAGIARE